MRCSACSCRSFRPGRVWPRSCDHCGHGWVAHALQMLRPQRQVEAALPSRVFDLSSLVLYGAQAVPVRLKILLDRLFSVLTPEQVGRILQALGWCWRDYVRGYMLQVPGGTALDRWSMVTPEEEPLILRQFLRFGETRTIVQLMSGSPAPNTLGEGWRPAASAEAPAGGRGLPPTVQPVLPPAQVFAGGGVQGPGPHGSRPDRIQTPAGTPQPSFLYPAPPPAGCPAGGRRGRVPCGVCGKSFYDKGTLKIHHNAVHLKIKHGCTVAGCSMLFSSLRSRNRHSANPNPRLHANVGDTPTLTAGPGIALATTGDPVQRRDPRVWTPPGWPLQRPLSLRAGLAPPPSLQPHAHHWWDQRSQFQPPPAAPDPCRSPLGGSPSAARCQAPPTKKKPRKSSTPVKIKQEEEQEEEEQQQHHHSLTLF